MEGFVGPDFLSRSPPPNYRPGIDRGDYGWGNAEKVVKNVPPEPKKKRAQRETQLDEEADAIYAAIERRAKKTKPIAKPQPMPKAGSSQPMPEAGSSQPMKPVGSSQLEEISIEEWAKLPEAQDITHSNKRLREEEANSRRFYWLDQVDTSGLAKVVDSELTSELSGGPSGPRGGPSGSQGTLADLRKRDNFELLVRRQPRNASGWLQLARLEEAEGRVSAAIKTARRGCDLVVGNEELWLLSVRLHNLRKTSLALAVARDAVKALPKSEPLWLALVDLEPTKQRKTQSVQTALGGDLAASEKLWLLAADLEPALKTEILETALQFVDTPQIWLALASANHTAETNDTTETNDKVETLHKAAAKHPQTPEIWLQLLEFKDVGAEALNALGREFWLAELVKSPHGPQILPHLQPTPAEFAPLVPNEWNRTYLAQPELAAAVLRYEGAASPKWPEALQIHPHNAELWDLATQMLDAAQLKPLLPTAPPEIPEPVLRKLAAYGVAWMDSPEQYLQQNKIDEGIARWPDFAPFYIFQSHHTSEPEVLLRKALKPTKNDVRIWLALASLDASEIRRRAVFTEAMAAVDDSQLWLARIAFELAHHKPAKHLVSEALARFPNCGGLWVHDLELTPVNQRTKRLALALKTTQMAPEVLRYGVGHFKALKMDAKAQQWQAMLEKRSVN